MNPETAPDRAVDRAARTKRSRTRRQVHEAFAHLLAVREYDDIRVADIAREAGVGQATVYNTFDTKGGVVSGLFAAITSDVEAHTKELVRSIDDLDPGNQSAACVAVLGDHLLRFAEVWADPANRRIGRAFVRAYATECVGLSHPNPVLQALLGSAQTIVNRALVHRPLAHPQLAVAEIGEIWTYTFLVMALAEAPPRVRPSAVNLLSVYIPDWMSLPLPITTEHSN